MSSAWCVNISISSLLANAPSKSDLLKISLDASSCSQTRLQPHGHRRSGFQPPAVRRQSTVSRVTVEIQSSHRCGARGGFNPSGVRFGLFGPAARDFWKHQSHHRYRFVASIPTACPFITTPTCRLCSVRNAHRYRLCPDGEEKFDNAAMPRPTLTDPRLCFVVWIISHGSFRGSWWRALHRAFSATSILFDLRGYSIYRGLVLWSAKSACRFIGKMNATSVCCCHRRTRHRSPVMRGYQLRSDCHPAAVIRSFRIWCCRLTVDLGFEVCGFVFVCWYFARVLFGFPASPAFLLMHWTSLGLTRRLWTLRCSWTLVRCSTVTCARLKSMKSSTSAWFSFHAPAVWVGFRRAFSV